MANVELNIGVDLVHLNLNALFQSYQTIADENAAPATYYQFSEDYSQFETSGSALDFFSIDWLTAPSVNSIFSFPGIVGADYQVIMLFGDNLQMDADFLESGPVSSIVVTTVDLDGLVAITGLFDIQAADLVHAMETRTLTDDRRVLANMFSSDDVFNLSAARDVVSGFGGNDSIMGSGGNDVLTGGSGQDYIDGGNDNDRLLGGAGADTIVGGAGRDVINGGLGRDILTGGAGFDRFDFNRIRETRAGELSADRITDFEIGDDVIDLSGIDAYAPSRANNTFSFAGEGNLHAGRGGSVSYIWENNAGRENDYTVILIDTDRDAAAEGMIRLQGLHTLTADDFIL